MYFPLVALMIARANIVVFLFYGIINGVLGVVTAWSLQEFDPGNAGEYIGIPAIAAAGVWLFKLLLKWIEKERRDATDTMKESLKHERDQNKQLQDRNDRLMERIDRLLEERK